MTPVTAKSTFWRRHRRNINLWTFFAFLVTAIITVFTPPTYQVSALVSLPPGVHSADIAVHLQAETLQLPVPSVSPTNNLHYFVRSVGQDSPEVVALVAEAEDRQGLPEVVDKWAVITLENLGDKASILAHAEVPRRPVKPDKPLDMFLGTFFGWLIGLGISGVRETSRNRGAILSVSDVNTGTGTGSK